MRHATLVGLFILALAFVVPGAASGATVKISGSEWQLMMVFEATAGEVNEVTVSDTPGGIEFRDAAAFVAPGDGCVAVDAHAAVCSASGEYFGVRVRAGDLNDTVSTALCTLCKGLVVVRGGEGDDTVSAGIGWSKAYGGAGDDTVSAGTGRLEAYGGAGDDTLTGGPFDDVLNGGAGADTMDGAKHYDGDIVSYAGHLVPVTVTLDADPSDGAESEGDSVLNFEGAVGGDGPDRLVGDARYNDLDGGLGHDVLRGRAGDDWLVGGPGADEIRAGRGHDTGVGGDGHDWIHGGPGDDGINGGHVGAGARWLDLRGKDTIYGGTGSDDLDGYGGADRLVGGDGYDWLGGGGGPDVLLGGPGRDQLYGRSAVHFRDGAVDRLFGGTEHDTASVERHLDVLRGVETVHVR